MKVFLPALLAPIASLLFISSAQAALRTQAVEYRHGDAVLEGYLAYDDAVKGKRPGVLIVHEWTGLETLCKRPGRAVGKAWLRGICH